METPRYLYHPDHFGSTSWVTDSAKNGVQYCEYLPFGEPLVDQWSTTWNSRYTFSGKERDSETGYSYFGARYYHSDLSIWLSVDPLYDERPWITPYNYCQNNPIGRKDPTGLLDWEPDKNGNLIAEKGDNAQTLFTFLGISQTNAQQMINNQNIATETNNGSVSVKAGETLTLDNVYTRSINNSTSDLTVDVDISGTSQTGATPEDYYNCWGSAIAGSQGQEIQVGVGIPYPNIFDDKLVSDYTPITEANAKFGKTVLRFADGENNTQHGAVFYGKSQDGTTYVYTKTAGILNLK